LNADRTPQLKARRWTTWNSEMTQALILSLATLIASACSRQPETPQQVFWRWFQANETRLFDFEKDQERVFDELQAQLHKVNSGLTFQFGPKEAGVREFVISADGIKDVFPVVISLADSAPHLSRWRVVKFRPRHGQGPISLNGLRIAPEQVKFTIEPDGAKVGLTLFIDGYKKTEHDKYAGVVFLMLDQSLGEYDVETKIGFVEFRPTAVESNLVKQPFSALMETVDRFVKSNAKE
jgi:hypothetical protein